MAPNVVCFNNVIDACTKGSNARRAEVVSERVVASRSASERLLPHTVASPHTCDVPLFRALASAIASARHFVARASMCLALRPCVSLRPKLLYLIGGRSSWMSRDQGPEGAMERRASRGKLVCSHAPLDHTLHRDVRSFYRSDPQRGRDAAEVSPRRGGGSA